ncbi:MAG TPA: sporulation protein [Alistipes sp.]|nr:sporulation protein [Alistipes sp.]HCN14409.1 sporulation protein [Alistipes sp.]
MGAGLAVWCALAAVGPLRAQQPEARIAGLERNEEYMRLLGEDLRLQQREDSTVRAVAEVRRRLRENPAEQQLHAAQILELENRIFEIRNAKGRLIDRINAIEQEWVLSNLNGSTPGRGEATATVAVPDSLKRRNLVFNGCFRDALGVDDYAALLSAQRRELEAVDYVNRLLANYAAQGELAGAYAAAATEEEAVEIHERFVALGGLNDALADSLSATWNYIFDNKSYAYGLVMEKAGCEEVLARQEERLAEAARELSALHGEVASEVLTDYLLRKRASVDFEATVAGALTLDAARDSLEGVAAQLAAIDHRLPPVRIVERSFIVYDSLAFSPAPRYTYQNPIPECRVYSVGTIYRLLVGTYATKRAASTFRGAYPLCYRIDDDGKWCYYAGSFATRDQAEAALKTAKARGFVRPEIVVWTDGQMRNLSREPEGGQAWRVEIVGAEALSDEVKAAIRDRAEGAELSRVGQQLFVVGLFDDRSLADALADELRRLEGALEIKVTEIAE